MYTTLVIVIFINSRRWHLLNVMTATIGNTVDKKMQRAWTAIAAETGRGLPSPAPNSTIQSVNRVPMERTLLYLLNITHIFAISARIVGQTVILSPIVPQRLTRSVGHAQEECLLTRMERV